MISKRLSKLKPSPTLALAAKAKELKANGQDVISLSVGEPDWDTYAPVKDAAISAIKEGQTKYAPAAGIPELRKAIAKQTSEDLGLEFKATEVTVSIGGKFILYSALQSLIDPGDEVIIPSPYWVSYPSMVELCDGVPIIATTGADSNFKLTPLTLEGLISKKTKILILNSPSNPSGVAYSREELEALGEVLKFHPQVVVISDDIYNRLIFDQQGVAPHILQVHPELKDRTLVVNGLAKTYSMTGWRVGWALGPEPLVQAMSRLQSQSVSCASPFSQLAAVEAINNCQGLVAESLKILKDRRDFVVSLLREIEGVSVKVPDGAFYLWPNISKFFGKRIDGRLISNSSDFAEALLEKELVAAVPGGEFGQEGYLRLSYALDKERMGEAVRRIHNFTKVLI